jgi:hypothetical protein
LRFSIYIFLLTKQDKNSVPVKKWLLRSQLLTDINFHFIITVKLATSQVLLVYQNPLLPFVLHSHPPDTCRANAIITDVQFELFEPCTIYWHDALSLHLHTTPLKTEVNFNWKSIFRPPKSNHTTNHSLRTWFARSWVWHINLSTDCHTIYCLLLQSLLPQKKNRLT